MVAVPTGMQPVSTGYFLVGREPTPAVVAPVLTAVKAKPFKPVNKYTWLEDMSMWGDALELHDMQQGPYWAESEVPESPLYGDTFGHFLFNFFGDYYATGTGTTPTWTTTVVPVAGGTVLTVGAGSTAVSGTFIQVDTSTSSEVVTVGTGSTGTTISINANTPLRFNHGTAVTVTTCVAPFVHTFATLNPNSSTGLTNCQPPTHTFAHYNYLPGSGGYYADEFLYGCLSELTITGKADGWMTWGCKLTSYGQSAPAGAITASVSTVKGIPAWKSTSTEASSAVNDISMWTATWSHKMDVIPTADGVQSPYFIGRGASTNSFKLTVDPAVDETQLALMTGNTQPTLAWSVSNGLAGANLVSLAINSQLAGYQDVPLEATKEFWGYSVTGKFVGSSTGAGNSGGRTYSQLVLTNAVPSY